MSAALRAAADAGYSRNFDRQRPTDFVQYTAAHRPLYAAFESQQSVLHTAERS